MSHFLRTLLTLWKKIVEDGLDLPDTSVDLTMLENRAIFGRKFWAGVAETVWWNYLAEADDREGEAISRAKVLRWNFDTLTNVMDLASRSRCDIP